MGKKSRRKTRRRKRRNRGEKGRAPLFPSFSVSQKQQSCRDQRVVSTTLIPKEAAGAPGSKVTTSERVVE